MVRNNAIRSFNLLQLPVELVGEILRHLDCKHLLRCHSVCKSLHEIVSGSVQLQYQIELWADGMVDGGPGGPTTAERLTQLLERRRAWRSLEYTQRVPVRMSGHCNAYELVAGVFAKSMSTSAIASGSRHLVAAWLPSRTVPGKQLLREDLGTTLRDFAIDPTQDLIALVETPPPARAPSPAPPRVRVHLRTLSSNEPHPEALHAVVEHPTVFHVDNAYIQIVDDVVGFFFWGAGPGLVIWEWRTGRVLVSSVGSSQDRDAWDFAFLSNRAYMLANLGDHGSLDIFTFRGCSTGGGGAPAKVVSLRLPPVTAGITLVNMSVHSGPFTARAPAGRAFSTAPAARIHAVSIQYFQDQEALHRRFCLFVHNRTLLAYVDAWEARGGGAAGALQVPWDAWGPDASRFLPHHAPFQWLRYVHGQRVVMPPMNIQDGPSVEQLIRVLDFGVHPRRAEDDEVGDSGRAIKLYTPNTISPGDDMGHIFKHEVVSRLPCLILERSDEHYRYSGFMIDDERLIGLKTTAFSNSDMGDLDVFTF